MSTRPRHFSRIALLLSALVVLAFASVAVTVRQIAQEVDAQARRTIEAAIDNGLKVVIDQMGTRTDFAYDDDDYRRAVIERKPAALDQHVYISMLLGPGRSFSFLIDGNDAIIHASREKGPIARERAGAYLAPIRSTLTVLRERASAAILPGAEGGGFVYAKDFGTLPYLEGLLEIDIADFDGKPALIMAAALLPQNPKLIVDSRITMVVHAIYLSSGLYEMIAHAANIPSLGMASNKPGKAIHLLRNKAGDPVTTVSWDFSPPGQRVLEAATPIFLGSFALFLMMAAVATLMLQRLTGKLADGEAAALFAARHDGATGLANRAWFRTNLQARVASAKSGTRFVLALIDLDYFKPINDTFGHAAGDAVLVEVAKRLKELDRHVAFAGRLGGDEFVALSFDLDTDEAEAWGEHLRIALMKPVMFEGTRIDVSTSIGIVVAAGASEAELTKCADLALYRAKRDARGCSRLYDPAIDREEAPTMEANVDALREAARKLRGDSSASLARQNGHHNVHA